MNAQKSMRYDQNDYEALLASNIPASLCGACNLPCGQRG